MRDTKYHACPGREWLIPRDTTLVRKKGGGVGNMARKIETTAKGSGSTLSDKEGESEQTRGMLAGHPYTTPLRGVKRRILHDSFGLFELFPKISWGVCHDRGRELAAQRCLPWFKSFTIRA